MQQEIHPDYAPVIFLDTSCDKKFLINSTYKGDEKMKWEDGNEYTVCRIDTSSASHTFYTGGERLERAEGRIAKFRQKYQKSDAKKDSSDKA